MSLKVTENPTFDTRDAARMVAAESTGMGGLHLNEKYWTVQPTEVKVLWFISSVIYGVISIGDFHLWYFSTQ